MVDLNNGLDALRIEKKQEKESVSISLKDNNQNSNRNRAKNFHQHELPISALVHPLALDKQQMVSATLYQQHMVSLALEQQKIVSPALDQQQILPPALFQQHIISGDEILSTFDAQDLATPPCILPHDDSDPFSDEDWSEEFFIEDFVQE